MMEKNKKRILLEIDLKNNSIEYEFNQAEEEIIIANNLLLYGILGKIQKNLLDLDSMEIPESEEKNSNEKENEDTDGTESDESDEEETD